ncbi:hypothetical protein [Streptomyces roseolus]|uniref:hypothetical protein n=1 Tax=Streptomyces roseolus TaxID=67358 RepID=UPI003654F848
MPGSAGCTPSCTGSACSAPSAPPGRRPERPARARGGAARGPTDHVLDRQEDARPARVIARTPNRPEPIEAESLRRPDPVEAAFAAGRPPGVPRTAAHLSHAMRTLRMPYLLADAGVRPRTGAPTPDRRPDPVRTRHAEPLKRHLAQVLPLVFQAA